jgi:predicted lipoprotein with Yx(FWY)xxD motif
MNSFSLPSRSPRFTARLVQASAVGATALFLLAGCSKTSDTTATGDTASSAAVTSSSSASPGSTAASASASAASIKLASTPLGMVIVDEKGLTLYLYTKDTGTSSTCEGACATAWPPATVTGSPTAGSGLDQSKVATTMRTDGTTQITYAGHPLYRFMQDTAPGQTNGEAVGGIWFAVDASGAQVKKA